MSRCTVQDFGIRIENLEFVRWSVGLGKGSDSTLALRVKSDCEGSPGVGFSVEVAYIERMVY